MKILLVDDERINSLSASRLLEKNGHTVTVAVNGLQALEELMKSDFDCILMDIQMPEMDGLEATARIRNDSAFGEKSKTPIIAMTGHCYNESEREFKEAGINHYVCKPFDIAILLDVIEQATS